MKLRSINWCFMCFLFGFQLLNAQSTELFVVASAGNEFENESFSLSYTMGEWMTETFSAEGFILTQGFQQTGLTVETWLQESYGQWDVRVYPNPVEDHLYIHFQGDYLGKISFELFDLEGRKIMVKNSEKSFNREIISIDLTQVANGLYVLMITTEDFNFWNISRIEKQ